MAQGTNSSSIAAEVLEDIPVKLNPGKICDQLHIRWDDERKRIQTMVEEARHLIKACAAYRVCHIEEKLDKAVVVAEQLLDVEDVIRNYAAVSALGAFSASLVRAFSCLSGVETWANSPITCRMSPACPASDTTLVSFT